MPITRVTVIAAEPFDDEDVGARLAASAAAAAASTAVTRSTSALAHVNRAVAAYRVSRRRPPRARRVARPGRAGAARLRNGPELVDGAWDDAIVVPPEHGRPRVRRRMLAPEQELAGILTGRRARDPAERGAAAARAPRPRQRPARRGRAAGARRSRGAAGGARARGRPATPRSRAESRPRRAFRKAAMSDALSAAQLEELEALVTELERVVRAQALRRDRLSRSAVRRDPALERLEDRGEAPLEPAPAPERQQRAVQQRCTLDASPRAARACVADRAQRPAHARDACPRRRAALPASLVGGSCLDDARACGAADARAARACAPPRRAPGRRRAAARGSRPR